MERAQLGYAQEYANMCWSAYQVAVSEGTAYGWAAISDTLNAFLYAERLLIEAIRSCNAVSN